MNKLIDKLNQRLQISRMSIADKNIEYHIKKQKKVSTVKK